MIFCEIQHGKLNKAASESDFLHNEDETPAVVDASFGTRLPY